MILGLCKNYLLIIEPMTYLVIKDTWLGASMAYWLTYRFGLTKKINYLLPLHTSVQANKNKSMSLSFFYKEVPESI